jgi:hypothetical protein
MGVGSIPRISEVGDSPVIGPLLTWRVAPADCELGLGVPETGSVGGRFRLIRDWSAKFVDEAG